MYKERVKAGGLAVFAAAMLMACVVVVLSLTNEVCVLSQFSKCWM
jgi:hypothetical protein